MQVCAVIFCDNPVCQRPRLLFSMNKPGQGMLKAMDAYAETISYQCGNPLFEQGMEDSPDNTHLIKLKQTFLCERPRRARTTSNVICM